MEETEAALEESEVLTPQGAPGPHEPVLSHPCALFLTSSSELQFSGVISPI